MALNVFADSAYQFNPAPSIHHAAMPFKVITRGPLNTEIRAQSGGGPLNASAVVASA
jgi:hypothetical protein